MSQERESRPPWILPGLGADGPEPTLREKLMLLGQFVGDWDIAECRYAQPDGTWVERVGEVHWRWILDGKAVQDVWSWREKSSGKYLSSGTTVRFYDPSIDAWHSVWIHPDRRLVEQFTARRVNDEVVLEGRHPDGHAERWIFSEIRPESFRWHSDESWDDGKTWKLTNEMRIRRQKGAP